MTRTLSTAISQVRFLLDETSAQFWTDAMIASFLNQACADIARQAQSLWMQYTFAAVPRTPANTTQPVANYPAPADLLGIHKMTFLIKTGGVSSQQYFNLEFRGIKQMDEIWGILHQLPAAYPNAFYLWNNPAIQEAVVEASIVAYRVPTLPFTPAPTNLFELHGHATLSITFTLGTVGTLHTITDAVNAINGATTTTFTTSTPKHRFSHFARASIFRGKILITLTGATSGGGTTGNTWFSQCRTNNTPLTHFGFYTPAHTPTTRQHFSGGRNASGTHPPGTHWYLGIYPVPATTGTFTLYYYRKARNATGTTTTLDVTVGYEDIPLWYAVYMAKYRDRDPTWQTAKAQYDAMLVKMIDNTSRFTDESSQFVDTSNAQWPVYLYSESGSGF